MEGYQKQQERRHTLIKESILQKDIKIFNVNAPNNRGSNSVRQKLIELIREIDESTLLVGDFNILLSEMDRASRQKISKDIIELKTLSIDWI